jgi:hypothetical protein
MSAPCLSSAVAGEGTEEKAQHVGSIAFLRFSQGKEPRKSPAYRPHSLPPLSQGKEPRKSPACRLHSLPPLSQGKEPRKSPAYRLHSLPPLSQGKEPRTSTAYRLPPLRMQCAGEGRGGGKIKLVTSLLLYRSMDVRRGADRIRCIQSNLNVVAACSARPGFRGSFGNIADVCTRSTRLKEFYFELLAAVFCSSIGVCPTPLYRAKINQRIQLLRNAGAYGQLCAGSGVLISQE